jgi:hypothetical protein
MGIVLFKPSQDCESIFQDMQSLSNSQQYGLALVIKLPLLDKIEDLIHPLFLNSMGELGTENQILSVLKQNVGDADIELIRKSGVSRGTFYKYKRILQVKGLISK